MFDVNFWGSIKLTQYFLSLIRENQGRIIFISSIAGVQTMSGNVVHALGGDFI
jgi:NAD(P)-dependent dehydrogenase (short-subunit alcohol dehydrogenase family)